MARDKVDALYDNLKEDGWVENSREHFRAFFLAPGAQGYKNRKALYDNMKEDGYVESPTYEEFARRMGMQPVQPKPAAPTPKPTPKPAAATPAETYRAFKVRRGGKDMYIPETEVKASGGLYGWAAKHPGAPLRVYMHSKDNGRTFTGHVDLSQAHNHSAKDGYFYTTVNVRSNAKPAGNSGKGIRPTAEQAAQFHNSLQQQVATGNAQLRQQTDDAVKRMDAIKKGNRPDAGLGKVKINPKSGKWERQYTTVQGKETGSRMEQSQQNTAYNTWWENNTEQGRRSKEQRLQREFDERMAGLWRRNDSGEGANAVERAWNDATQRTRTAQTANADRTWDVLSGGPEMRVVNASLTAHGNQVARLTNFDLDRLMNESWNNLGTKGQKALVDDCYKMLVRRYPGADGIKLYEEAKKMARQQSDLRLYNYAVEKNRPKSELTYLMRKIGDMNMLGNIQKGLAVSRAGSTGDMAAYEAANEQYRQDGHKVLDIAGTVAGFALDPTTWLSGGIGSATTKGVLSLAGRGATAAVKKAATRKFATSMTGRVLGGMAGGAANFGAFEGIKELENQFAHGGKVTGQDETGRYVNEGYSASAVGGQALHGFLMGGAIGWLSPVSGNVSDLLVGMTESTIGKVVTRGGVFTGATIAEGTIFSVPEWMEGERDGFDVWTDNMAMMAGFKAKHVLKSAGGVLGDLKASFLHPSNGNKNRLDFESRLRMRMDAPSDGGMALTKDEKEELQRHGYDLSDLVKSSERTGNAAEGSLIARNAPEIVSRLTEMVTDSRVSEAARAKMYYYATGRKLPMSTVMRGELMEDGKGGFIVESQGANGVITSRRYTSRKAADLELRRIKRQVELNQIELGERYQQTADLENRLQDACRSVAAENGWDPVTVYRLCEEARRDYQRGEDKELDEARKHILRQVTEAMGEFEETAATDIMRGRINDKFGVDIDAAIRKEPTRRSDKEQKAIDAYIAALFPEKGKEVNSVVDADAEDLTGQPLLPESDTSAGKPAAQETKAGEERAAETPLEERAAETPLEERAAETPGGENSGVATDGEMKPIGRAVMKYQDREVEVLSGNIVMTDDGTMVDNARSDSVVVVRDKATGKKEMVSPQAILTYESYPAEPEPAEAPEAPARKYGKGVIRFHDSDGKEKLGWITGDLDDNGRIEYYAAGERRLRYATEEELDGIITSYEPDKPAPATAQPRFALNDEFTIMGRNGEMIQATVTKEVNEDGLVEVYTEQPINGSVVNQFTPEELTGMVATYNGEAISRPEEAPQGEVTMPTGVNPVGSIAVPQRDGSTRTFTVGKNAEGENVMIDERGFMWAHDGNGNALQPYSPGANVPTWTDEQLAKLGTFQPANEQPVSVPNQSESVPTSTEMSENPTENGVSPAGRVPKPAVSVENVQGTQATAPTAEPTPLQRLPRDAKGEPVFERAESAEHGWDALVEFSEGDAATAKEIADTMAEEKRKVYEKAQKQKPKGKTPTEILASKKAITAELAQAEQEYNLWQQMANVEQRRQAAIRSQQEAEARQRAAERAEAEKAEREAREEAARLEREALEGIPEWHLDTPENARKRGVRRFGGQMFTRQEPVQGVGGKEVEVKFSQKDLPKGHLAVIEAPQLQPSHIQGQRNPMFFIEEAQPKNRAEAVSMFAAKEMAEGIRPQEITGSATAYTGAPTVNTRGEVIQGNNRSDALRYLWENKLPEQQQTYKQYLIDNAEQFGLDPDAVNAMQQPVLVNMLDVDDAEAIRLGQMTAQDTESGGVERIKPKNVAQKLGEDMRSFASQLLRSGDEEASFGQLVDRNGTEVLKWMAQKGAITNTQYQSAFDSKGNLTAEAKNDLQKVLYQAVFKGGSQQLEEMFDALPAKAQRAILSTAFRDMDSPFAGKMLPEIQASIAAFNQLMNDPTFAAAKKLEEVLRVVEGFKRSIQLDDRFEQYMPADNFSNFALHLAAMYKANDMSQSTLTSYFNQMYDLAQGKKAATLFEEADTTEYPLADVIKQVLNIDYKPAKNGNNNVANGGADVALRNQDGQGGELRGNEPPASGEQNPTGTEPTDRGAGASDDSRAAAEVVKAEPEPQAPATVQTAVEAASSQVNTTPTPAQAEAGNYKKGHVTIGEFDITIENPAGSVRKGVDADGKEWSNTMANTYGYIKGTEGVDGDHIDVFLHSDMDQWNGRKVFVVDQTNRDGSFDEHKVMLGFNDKDEAMTAYLANYDKTWADTHPGLRISETNIEDFNKWVQSSHRKTKPFADYTTVSKVVDEAPVKTEANIGEGYKIESKPYTNKQGKTLDTYLVTFDRDFSKEELSALRAKAKALKGWYDRESKGWMLRSSEDAKAFADDVTAKSEDEVADEAPLSMADMEKPKPAAKPKKAEPLMSDRGTTGGPLSDTGIVEGALGKKYRHENGNNYLVIGKKITKDGVKVTRIDRGGSYDAYISVPELADALSNGNWHPAEESPMKQVDVEGVFDALKTKGETKLSDHATPVEEAPKPKKRRWISDEDADEFDSLRKDLRSHFGKDGDIVQEAGAEYGKPKPKQMDAEVLRMGTRMTYLMMKGGLRSFSDYCEAMKDELPDIFDDMRPHLKSLYAAAQNMEEVIELGWDEEMDDRKTVKAFDVYNFDKPGAKDIIATAQHAVDENASQQQTNQIIQTLKDQRNEQRKKEADETSADTETIIDKAETTASQVESKLEAANSEEDAEGLSRSLDKELEEVNKQLALLGYYEADPVDKDFNEAYGYMRNAERKAVQDAHRLATQLAADLGITIDPKDKVRKAKYGFGSKIARSNVAPAGGEVYITLPLAEGRELSIWLSLDKNEPWREGGREDRYDEDLMLTGIMYRVENTGKGGMSRYESSNHNTRPTIPYDELLADIRRLVRTYLPDETVKPATPLTPQPGEDMVDVAKRVAADKEPKAPAVEPQLPIGDLFGGLFDEQPQAPQPTAPAKDKEIDPATKRVVDILKGGGLKPTKAKNDNLCKLLPQYEDMKQKHPDAMLLFRSGNNYYVLSADAEEVANLLNLPLSKFTNDGTEIPFTEFPHHALDKYLPQMVRAGKRVAVCEQIDEPEVKIERKPKSEVSTSKPKSNEKTDVQPRTEGTGRGGQQPRPNEPLGEGAKNEDERTDGGRMAQRGGEHSVSNSDRSAGVSGQHQSERGVTAPRTPVAPKNTRNNHAERGTDYAPKGEKARIDANIAALELAKKLLASGRAATPQEMAILRRYSGWGGLGAAFNEGSAWAPNPVNKRLREALTPEEYQAAVMSRNSAYYTPAAVIDAMWDVAKALGFKGGNIVEGSAGIGNIIGLMPTDISERSNIHAVEIDPTTGGILSLLYPDAKVEVQGFEQTRIANGSVDLAITNVPFVTDLHVKDESGDSDLSKKFRDIHDFCIAKNVRKLCEGGIGIFITSSGTLDKSQKLRNWLVGDKEGNADVVGVFRMNNQTFGGTVATSDIIIVRKRVNGRRSANAIDVSTVTPARTATFTDARGKTKDLPLYVNRYFIEHPEHMGGEMFFGFEQGDTYRPTSIGLFPTRTADQSARMAAWVQHLADMDWRTEAVSQTTEQTSHINEALGEGVKEGSMVTDSEGNLCVARMGRAVPLTLNKNKIKGRTKEECFKDYTEIKSALADVLKYQTEHDDDAGLQPLLDRLNRAYDTFVQRYGNLNKNNNLAWLRNDVDFSSIVALETYSEKGNKDGTKVKTYGKTDIFSRRVVEKESEPAPKNVKDGIIASIYKYGRIDTEYLATQLGKSQDDVKQEIVDSGLGFVDPTTGQMEVSYEYLSGNVREKLRQAREANEAAEGAYDANIKALEAVVPMNIPAHLIEFALGSSWIEPQLYEKYIKERTELDVKLTNAGGTWHMAKPWNTDKPKNTEMGVRSEAFGILIPGHKLIEAALTNKTITVSRTVKDSDGGSHTETDSAATTACATKVDEIRQDFKDWAREQMQNDPALSMRMEEKYNEKFNNSVPKTIPDEFVPEHFGGAATTVGGRPFKLRPHQAKAVIRATTQPVLLAHEVGTGKTYTLITTAMEMRRLGTARKPMIVVQNATVGQFVASAKALYPNAKVLTLEDADRNAEGRRAFYAKIKFNDWDMIVVPQSVFERIPDSIERQTQFIQDKIEEKMLVLEQMKEADPDGRSMIVRAAEREISRLEDEMSQLASGEPQPTSGKKKKDAKKAAITRQNAEVKARELLDRATDDVEDFDSMGIDAILVDEAHEYKHLGFATAMQRGVKGVDPSPSKKPQGVFLKAQAVLEKTGGKNVVFATGTPISNTAAEIWTFMRYLIPTDVMKEYDIYYFDDFVRNFGNLQQMLEFKTNGKYDEVNRFAGYVNLPELVRIWSTVADTVLTREAGGVSDKIPQMEGGKAQDIFLPQTRALRSIMKFVKEELDRYENMTGKEKKENSHIPLVMYGIAKAAAVDARLVQSDAEDDPNSKTNEAVRQTLRTLEETKEYKGTVAIFADNYQNKHSGFNLYEDIRKKLIAAGVPEEQVVVMKSGMTVKKKLEIFDRVNAGEVRVVMGSTFTLGTGVNIQERLHTLIHLDAPNRPMDYTQRNGRILRQGNLHNTWGLPVRVLRFGVEDSLDVTAYQRLKTKGAIADSIMNGKQLMANSMENRSLEEDQDLFGDITAQLSGSEYAMLKNQIEKEVRKLRAAEKNWKADQTYIHNRKRQIAGQNREAEKRIADNQSYLEKVEAATIGDITVGKLSFPSVDAMEDFFTEQNKKKAAMQEQVRTSGYSSRPATSDITISVGGFNFKIHTEITKEMKHQQGDLFATAPAKMTYSCPELGIDAMPVRGNAIKNAVLDIMENVVSGKDFRERIANAENYLERNNAELEAISKRDGQPFKDAEALEKAEEKLAEYEELMKAEMAAKEAKYAEMDKDVEAAAGIELTEEDSEPTASEPAMDYSAENTNFVSRYETKDGKTVRYTSENPEAYGGLFDFDFSNDVPGTDNAAEGGRVNRRQQSNPPLQRRNAALLDTNASARLNEANGEYCALERKFRESNYMEFTSAEKVESADDVAFIFEELENASVENVFVVMTKRGVPTVMHISIGGFNWSAMNAAPVKLAYDRIKPDKVYFVHNHPSGALNCSAQDVNCLKQIESAIGKKAEGVIMNLKSGKYGTFDSSGTDSSASHDKAPAPAVQRRLRLYAFDRHVFNPDYQPSANMRSAEDVAKFLSSHRLGDRSKVSVLVCNNQNQIVANVHTTHVSIDSKGLADDIIRAIGEFGGMHAFLYGDFEQGGMVAYRNLTQAVKERSGGVYNLLDVMRIEGNHTWSARDNGYAYEPGCEYGASPEGDIRFREVEDDVVLKEFAEGKTVKAYRTMQVIDGKLYSPMATKVGGKTTPEIKLGVPEQAEEHPEIIKKTIINKDGNEQGIVVIDKGLGKGSLKVAYNPYVHTSRTVLNDQFSSAYKRPNLVTVEVEVPESELTSGYRADKAKNTVGEMSWHSGTVSGQLAQLGKPRRVILSRYDRPVRIVPFKEVAAMIAEQLDGTDIAIPYNVVQPQVRAELERLGVTISEEATGTVDDGDFGEAEYVTDQEVERINAHQQEMAQTSPESKSHHAEKLAKKFNTPIQVVTDPKELTSDNADRQARMRRSKGFYDPTTGKVVVVLPNNANVEDVAETVFHEVVAHKGLREMLGDKNYDAFCDEVYDHLKDDLKEEVDRETTRRFEREPEKGYEHHRRVSVDELFGRMAEKGFEDFTKAERGIWAKLKAKVLEAINKFLGSLKLPKWVRLGDNELRYMLWRSHEKLRTKGDYVDMARDAAKREELGLSAEARFRDGETGDIWKDQSVGLQERITNAAIRLSNNQSGDLTLRNDAQKAVVNNLQSLLHSMRNRRGTAQSFVGADRKVEAGVVGAMNAQAMFDRATVKRVSDLARILMQNGYLSGMTSGEMQRLLSVVKNATAMHDISDSVQKIMDIMVNNQLRNAEGALRQLLSIRGSKVDARGVEVQGVLDVDGQRTMEVVKKAMSLSEDDITDRIAEALNRMGDPDQTIADQAALEYAGLNMALDYVQNIANSKAEEKTLRDSLKTAKEDRDAGRMTDDAYKQFVEATEDAIRKNKVERAEAYFNLVGRLSDSLRESIENAKAFRETEKARVSEIHHNANSDMEGRPPNEHHKDNWKDKFVNNGFVQFLFAPLGTFDQILRVFGNKSANGEGYLWNRFMRGWVECRNRELQGVKEKFARLDAKASELFGKGNTWGNLIRMEAKLPKATVSFWDGGEMRDHELTQGNLLYIYMVDKMTDGRMKLRRMGITEEDVTNIENILDPRFKALGDWLQDEFLVDTRNEYNETHRRMFGASMAAIENYFPLKILANARVDKEEDVNQQNRPDGITTKTGSIIKRRVNNLALDITGADALSVILDHITQMEHWNAYAEWNRDLNTLRTYKRFRNQVMNMTTVYGGGRKLWNNFNNLCLMAAGEYRPPIADLDKSAVNIAKGVTAAKVSFRLFTALKQFLSAIAYAPEVSIGTILKSIVNPFGAFKWCLENMPIFRERWQSRISGDPRLLKSNMDWKMWRSRVMEISSRIGMTPNAFIDAVTVAIGAKAMHDSRLKQYLREGYSPEQARKRAMEDATILFNQTQQSSESPFLSTMQVDRSWLSVLFTVFRNSSMSYTRQVYDGMRNLKRNLTPGQRAQTIEYMTKQILRDWGIEPENATKAEREKAEESARKRFRRQIRKDVLRVATFGFLAEWAWNLGAYLPYLLFGNDDDEKDKMWDDALTHAYFGSVEGLTGGDVLSSFGNMAVGGEWSWNQLSKDMPMASDINTIASKFIGGKNAEAINDIVNLLIQSGIGMNPQSITDAAVAIMDACGDDPALSHEAAIFVMRVLQVPQSQLDKLYFDEIGLSGAEASKLTPTQLARRYAEYKVKRGTTLMPWTWGDEERLGKYSEQAEKRIKERMAAEGESADIAAYEDYERRSEATGKQLREAKALWDKDALAGAAAYARIAEPELRVHDLFAGTGQGDGLDKQLQDLTKVWLGAESAEEATLAARAIPAYRKGMVKALGAKSEAERNAAFAELNMLLTRFYEEYERLRERRERREKEKKRG